MTRPKVTDTSIEHLVAALLRTGVSISGAVVLGGGIYYLLRHGREAVDYRSFHGQPSIDRIADEIVKGAIDLRARSIIQIGVLLLIATPIARVAASLVGFALERDRTYVVITAIVLATLLFSLMSGAALG